MRWFWIGAGVLAVSVLIVWESGSAGVKVERYEEIEEAFPYEAGFPLQYVTVMSPKIDPPVPHRYSGNCCFRRYEWDRFFYSVLLVSAGLFSAVWLVDRARRHIGSA